MVIAFTGHRPASLGGYKHNPLHQRAIDAIREKVCALRDAHGSGLLVLSGMALGVDQWVVEACIAHAVQFDAYVPYVGQELTWPTNSQEHYHKLLADARHIHCVCHGPYANWKLQARNEAMVDACDLLVAVWNGDKGGTANCVAYANSVEKPVERLKW